MSIKNFNYLELKRPSFPLEYLDLIKSRTLEYLLEEVSALDTESFNKTGHSIIEDINRCIRNYERSFYLEETALGETINIYNQYAKLFSFTLEVKYPYIEIEEMPLIYLYIESSFKPFYNPSFVINLETGEGEFPLSSDYIYGFYGSEFGYKQRIYCQLQDDCLVFSTKLLFSNNELLQYHESLV